jgi:two-component system, LytTR family, sensor kinase
MAGVTPAIVSEDATAEILQVHTAICVMGVGVTIILLRALLLLRRGGESLPGLLTMMWIMLVMEFCRAVWLAFQWLLKPAPLLLDVVSLVAGFIVIVGVPVLVSAKYLPREGAYAVAPKPWAWLQRAMVITAVLGFGALLCALLFRTRSGVFLGPAAVNVLTALLLLSRISLYRHLQVRRRPLVLFAACMIAGLLLMSAYITYSVWTGVRIRESLTLVLLNATSLMLILSGIIFVFANVRLADVIVKRALRIVLWTCGSVAVWLLVARCFTLIAKTMNQGLVCIAIVGTALALAPVAERRLNLWVDRWVFQQLDFRAAIPVVWRELSELESQHAIFCAAERFLQKALHLAAVRILRFGAAGENLRPSRPGPYFLAPTDRLAQAVSPPASMVVPLFLEGEADYVIVISLGVVRPPLTALETGFVERVGGQVQIRLGMLLAEQRRTEQVRREALFRQEVSDAELRALRAQVNPHFLFNSLNTIADLTVIAPDQAEEMTLRLSAVFRYVLVNTDRHFTSLKEELEFARSYLDLEQTRFGDRLKVNFDIDPATLGLTIPTLLLQPLIENALKHGLSPKREGGSLIIRSAVANDGIFISVSDDGVGLRARCKEPNKRSTSVGVQNVSNRLRTAYGGRASFTLRPRREGGTEALIVIPRGQ